MAPNALHRIKVWEVLGRWEASIQGAPAQALGAPTHRPHPTSIALTIPQPPTTPPTTTHTPHRALSPGVQPAQDAGAQPQGGGAGRAGHLRGGAAPLLASLPGLPVWRVCLLSAAQWACTGGGGGPQAAHACSSLLRGTPYLFVACLWAQAPGFIKAPFTLAQLQQTAATGGLWPALDRGQWAASRPCGPDTGSVESRAGFAKDS